MRKNDANVGQWFCMLVCASVSMCGVDADAGTGRPFTIAGTSQAEVAVCAAFDGSNFLIPIRGNELSNSNVSAQLISQTGAFLSRTNIGRIGNVSRVGEGPAVGYGGGIFLMVWEDATGGPETDLYGQIVGPSGTLVGPAFPVSTAPGSQNPQGYCPFDGTNFLVVWTDSRIDEDIYAQLVSTGGVLVGAEIPIATSHPADERDAFESFDGTNFLVVFSTDVRPPSQSSEDVHGQFVSRSGSLIGTNFVIDQNDFPGDNPCNIAFDGSKYLVLFHDQMTNRTPVDWDIYGRFVRPSGEVGTSRFPVAASTNENEFYPGIDFDGTNFLITVLTGLGEEGFESNACVKGRFFDTNINAVTPWFSVLEAPGTNEFPILGNPLYFYGKYFLIVPTVKSNGSAVAVYGVFMDEQLPGFGNIRAGEGSLTLTITNLFLGGSICVERTSSLMPTNWVPAGSFVGTSATTNWSEIVSNEWDSIFYRLKWK